MSFQRDRDADTICAVSTPPGVGGISVLRISGSKALAIVQLIAGFLPKAPESHKVYFGTLEAKTNGQALDEVLVTYFAKGKSFTGEETLEISCHGNPQICRAIMNELISMGARAADRGEFTYRAFMNNKIDLVQAESVLALIESQSDLSSRQALRQLKGDLSKELEKLETDLIWMLANIEANIDFGTEGLEVVSQNDLLKNADEVLLRLKKLLSTFQTGKLIRDGFQLVLTGVPNVGKSSLLNLLAEEDRAIVTEVPGTTRDLVEAPFYVSGIKVHAVDTAGLRESTDVVEKIGIERSYQALKDADAVFFVFDVTQPLSEAELKELNRLDPNKTYLIGNKADQRKSLDSREQNLRVLPDTTLQQLATTEFFSKIANPVIYLASRAVSVSAHSQADRDLIKELLAAQLELGQYENQAVLSQARHFENLSKAFEAVARARMLISKEASTEFSALELKEALVAVQETLGKRYDDQIMDRVFKEFCIGK